MKQLFILRNLWFDWGRHSKLGLATWLSCAPSVSHSSWDQQDSLGMFLPW